MLRRFKPKIDTHLLLMLMILFRNLFCIGFLLFNLDTTNINETSFNINNNTLKISYIIIKVININNHPFNVNNRAHIDFGIDIVICVLALLMT
jgi:hypothetical protein